MTQEELAKIPFHFVAHLSMEHEHCSTYTSDDGRLGFCDHVRCLRSGKFGKSHRHFRIDNKIFKTKEAFLEALEDFEPNVVPISNKIKRLRK